MRETLVLQYSGWLMHYTKKSNDICKHTVTIFNVFSNPYYEMNHSYRCWDTTFESASIPTTIESSYLNIIQSVDFMQDYQARLVVV